jgi:lipoprotein-anchoring transpeptidase ErfK/SrfK
MRSIKAQLATLGTGHARPRRLRLTSIAVLLLFAAASGPAGVVPAGSTKQKPLAVKPAQRLARLLRAHEAFAKPHRHSAALGLVRARRPITGTRTVLPVIGRRAGRGKQTWLHVRLPGRPNGRTGWITKAGTAHALTSWHIVVRTSSRRVMVYRWSRLVRVFKAIVGKPSTPTPLGQFFVEESVRMPADAIGAPFALALSARSNVLQEFAAGPGQIAIHGLDNIGGVLGTAVSHGCLRVADRATRWLSQRIGPGVPVTIER